MTIQSSKNYNKLKMIKDFKFFTQALKQIWLILSNQQPYQNMKLAILGALLISLGFASTCGGNCPSGKCPHCYCGQTKKMENIATWCQKHNWNQSCCKCIVSHESGGNAHAMNYNTNGSTDVGLWQINSVNWHCNGGQAPCDPEKNLVCAVDVYKGSGNSWRPWSTHTACGC